MTDLKVHPVADLFPMLADDELKELAADIKQRGLLHPIVLDGPEDDGWLLDGRNRLAACEIAGVKPTFERYDGSDPVGYILATNINRRHLTKGQQAMVAAMACSETEQTQRSVAEQAGVSKGRIGQASTVREHGPDLVDAVISGAMSLDEAYKVARQRKTEADSTENQLAKLRAEDADLAARVVEGELTLKGAWAELGERQRKRVEEQRDARALLSRIVELTAPESITDGFVPAWAERLGDLDADLTVLVKRAEQAAHVLLDLAERVRQ